MKAITETTIFRETSEAALASLPIERRAFAQQVVDYYELTKPRMNFLILVTTLVGFYLASAHVVTSWLLLFNTLFGTLLTAASAAVMNQWMERRYDALMPRTRNRPLPAGRVGPTAALVFGIVLGAAGVLHLLAFVNPLTAGLGLFTHLSYLLIYTPMKRVTTLNTIIGAVPGAIPPMMGFTAVDNAISPGAWVLFGVLFLWQMPHFLAIAALYRDDYRLGGFKMLPVIDTDLAATCRMALLYTMALIPVSLLALPAQVSGMIYVATAVVLGLGFLWYGVKFYRSRQRSDARKLFFASIIYLPLLLAAMMIDRIG
ncbi:MAG TPA: heme o synthase [Tepidisphaeraceae bacterium]|nr:heme o synthase [Tepidisphaeraceae bacterium]